ncbi:methyltransferase domain-containing protein [Cumulibacter soli]|uniref:methyltransferase domain-containing protein n=1 Tax=Cumulibacter soli TaxID=2546344 RepID=UPI00106841CB|nr:methyltransferase domain-containing protein [Cumulibacter soli]
MQCDYFDANACRSCSLMGTPYEEQLRRKDAAVRGVLAAHIDPQMWLAPYRNTESGFRNKAKLAIGGTIATPTLGILDHGLGVDLRDCGLYEPALAYTFADLATFITTARLAPYDLATRRGELKNLLVTVSPDGEVMLRFVLRSQEPIARIRKYLPGLLAACPAIVAVSANILPEHRAVLEGDREIPLTERETLSMRLNDITMHVRPQSFFQTSTDIAAALYRQAASWAANHRPPDAWDLYCGVGGFALHLAAEGIAVTGVETSGEAIASASLSAADAQLDAQFVAADSLSFAAQHGAPGLVVVNPPRRGVGDLAAWLEHSTVSHIIYSSCNAASLATDLDAMPSYRARAARLFDMFPQTDHHEVMVLLQRR